VVLVGRKSIVWIGCWREEGRSVVVDGLLLWLLWEKRDCRSNSLLRGVGGRSLGGERGRSVDAKNALILVMVGDALDEKGPLTLYLSLVENVTLLRRVCRCLFGDGGPSAVETVCFGF